MKNTKHIILKISLIVFIVALIISLANTSLAAKTATKTYKELIDEAGVRSSGAIKYSNISSHYIFQDEITQQVGYKLDYYKPGNSFSGSDWDYIKNNHKNANCVYENAGDATDSLGLKYFQIGEVLDVNPDGERPLEIHLYSNGKDITNNTDNFVMMSYLAANNASWQTMQCFFWDNSTAMDKVIGKRGYMKTYATATTPWKNSAGSALVTEVTNYLTFVKARDSYEAGMEGVVTEVDSSKVSGLGGKKVVIGPFKVKFPSKTGINTAGITATYNGNAVTSAKFVDKNGNEITPKSNTNFYVEIKAGENITDTSKLKMSFTNTFKAYGARLIICIGERGRMAQNRGIYRAFYNIIVDKIPLKVTGNPPVKVVFYKQGDSKTALKGAEIKVTAGTGVKNLESYLQKSNEKGYLGYVEVEPTAKTGTFVLNYKETTTPYGYQGISGTKTITVTYDTGSGTAKVTGISSSETTLVVCKTKDEKPDRGYVYIKNQPILVPFYIHKEDFKGNYIEDVPFDIEISGAKAVIIGKSLYALDLNAIDDSIKNKCTTKDNLNSERTDSSGAKIKKSGSNIIVSGIETNANGNLKIVFIKNADEIKMSITEDGSVTQKLPTALKLSYKYNATDNTWKLGKDSSNSLSSDYFSFDSENSARVIIKNDVEINQILIRKNVENAKFRVQISNVKTAKIHKKFFNNETPKMLKGTATPNGDYYDLTDNGSGYIQIDNLYTKKITSLKNETGGDVIGILFQKIAVAHKQSQVGFDMRELQAPTGYTTINGLIKLKFSISKNGGFECTSKYKDSTITAEEWDESRVWNYKRATITGSTTARKIEKRTDGTTRNIQVDLTDRSITSTGLKLKLVKYDKSGHKLSGITFKAEFYQYNPVTSRYDIELIPAESRTTDSNGEAVFTEFDPPTTQNIKVVLTETSTKSGYKKLTKSLVFVVKHNGTTWNTAAFTSGGNQEGAGSNLAVNSNVISLDIKNEPEGTTTQEGDIQLAIRKVDTDGNPITNQNITFKVTYSQGWFSSVTYDNLKLDGSGYIQIPGYTPSSYSSNVTVTITETEHKGYQIVGNSTITLRYTPVTEEIMTIDPDTGEEVGTGTYRATGEWRLYSSNASNPVDVDYDESTGTTLASFEIENKSIPGISINDDLDSSEQEGFTKFERTSSDPEPVEGVKFTARFSQSGSPTKTFNGISDEEGHVMFYEGSEPAVYWPTNTSPVTVVVQEVPSNHYVTQPDKTYTFTYNASANEWQRSGGFSQTNEEENITYEQLDDVINIVKITSFTLDKQDPRNTGASMRGAKFDIEIENVSKVNGAAYNGGVLHATVPSSNKIVLNELEVIDPDEDVVITLTETDPPPSTSDYYYKAIEGEIVVTLSRGNDGDYVISDITYPDTNYTFEVVNESLSGANNNKVSVKVYNIPLIKIQGQVWIDVQKGEKSVKAPDGMKTGDPGLEGVDVYLYDNTKNEFSVDEDGEILVHETDGNGVYEIFEDLEQTDSGYTVVFEYNGIWYEGIGFMGQSKAAEVDRPGFNNKFKTIEKDTAIATDGSQTALEYKGYDIYDHAGSTPLLEAENNGTNSATDEKDFAIDARSNAITKIDLNVDCGVVERFFDLAIGTDIKNAEVRINGKSTTYDYAQIMDGNLQLNSAEKAKADGIIYNLYLYVSDYNYRISDYITDASTFSEANKDVVPTDPDPYKYDADKVVNNNGDNAGDKQELELYVTYDVILKNQADENGTVNHFVYYYDDKYIPQKLVVDSNALGGYRYEPQGDGETYNGVKNIASEHKLVYEGTGLDINNTNGYRQVVELTFKVDFSQISDDDIVVPEEDDEGVIFKNLTEITSYSSDGFIDDDSAPDNSGIESGEIENYEDDTDEANGIEIKVPETQERTIEGIVFEDLDRNGKMDGADVPVNDVTVQLIEIKKIGLKYYEYIWQETRSGSSTVKTTARNGYAGEDYDNGVTEDGRYLFTRYIPGNYIIRYIYGDGTTFNIIGGDQDQFNQFVENIMKYNGDDYKSTLDSQYNETWYNLTNYLYTTDVNKARDNEARRLEVMAYSTDIDKNLGAAIDAFMNDKTLTERDPNSLQYITAQQRQAILDYYLANPDPDTGERKGIRADYDEALANYGSPTGYLIANKTAEIFGISAGDPLPDRTISDLENDPTILYNDILEYISFKTWMCAETSKINVPVDGDKSTATGIETDSDSTSIDYMNARKEIVSFFDVNFGLALKPRTTMSLEKHITRLKITPSGVGVQPIVDASADIRDILDTILNNPNNIVVETTGMNAGLTSMASVRRDSAEANERGWWKVETDIEELAQGATLEATYTYAITNESEPDYLSRFLIDEYRTNIDSIDQYNELLNEKAIEVKNNTRNGIDSHGSFLGQWYYNGEERTTGMNPDTPVVARVETIEESINNDLTFVEQKSIQTDNDLNPETDPAYAIAFAKTNTEARAKLIEPTDEGGRDEDVQISTVVATINPSKVLDSKLITGTDRSVLSKHTDYTKTLAVEKVLHSSGSEGIGTELPSYSVEVTRYTTPSGSRDRSSVPGNMKYVFSKNNDRINAEMDEFWGERIIISKPTGEDKMKPLQIAVVAISAAAILGVGIVLIRRVVLKK